MGRAWRKGMAGGMLLVLAGSGLAADRVASPSSAARLVDTGDGADWAGYGRTNGQQHYSPLAEIDRTNVDGLGLAWSRDLDFGNTASEPIAVDGVLYFATGLSVVHAVDAVTGRELWSHDPHAAEAAGMNLRLGWGVRGLAWWSQGGKAKIYVGTQDGRLLALDAKTGAEVWSVQTYPHDYPAFISGAPRVFGGRVLIGYGGSGGATRGYVTAYDAMTGKQLWRFWTVPGDPAKGFENAAMAMAAKTWSGEWWKYGGGGDVWNAIAWDPQTDTVFIGVGSPYPWNHRVRSAGQGDNLFIDSIVALDARTGAYKWHYQTTPGDTWDFDAAMDIELADLVIDGKPRKVLMQAPKNGFFYVIDRVTGKFISAMPFVRVTWASGVDPQTGRPVEAPDARFADGKRVLLEPTPLAAHSWLPMAASPQSGLVYIPANRFALWFSDAAKDGAGKTWTPSTARVSDGAVDMVGGTGVPLGPLATKASGALIAWDPVAQKPAWSVEHPTYVNGGVLASAGGLVFQGEIDGAFKAYDAATGMTLWRFDARAPVLAPPITYRAGGHQYVTVLTGLGMAFPGNAAALQGMDVQKYGIDPRSQARRVLTFRLGGNATLPPRAAPPPAFADPEWKPEPGLMMPGGMAYAAHCATCHGSLAVGINYAPDLRRSPMPVSAEAFAAVVHDGALTPRGMPAFAEFDPATLEALRGYIRAQAAALRAAETGETPPTGIGPAMAHPAGP